MARPFHRSIAIVRCSKQTTKALSMTISAVCPACSHEFHLNDTMAGKKFRCKKCQSVVEAPTIDGDDWDETSSKKRKSQKAGGKSAKGKKKRSSGSGGGLLKWVAVGCGALLVLGTIGFGLTKLMAPGGALNNNVGGVPNEGGAPNEGGVSDVGGVSWTSFTTPDGHVTLKMPGQAGPIRKTPDGRDVFGATAGNITCTLLVNVDIVNHAEFKIDEVLEMRKESHANGRIVVINGHKAFRYSHTNENTRTEGAEVYSDLRVCTVLMLIIGTADPAAQEYYFNSITIK